MLVVSELGEAMEAHRKGKFASMDKLERLTNSRHGEGTEDNYPRAFELSTKDTFEDEIADAIIRLLDLSAGLGIDIENHINLKVEYNKSRERLHGKKY